MKIAIVCQDEPLYLSEALSSLFDRCKGHYTVDAVFLLNHSANGKKESFLAKALSVCRIFGIRYFIYLSLKFLSLKLGIRKSITSVCSEYGVSCSYVDGSLNDPNNVDKLRGMKFDVIVSIAGSQIFKKDVLACARRSFLNVHNALLPKYRGLMPVFWSLYNHEEFIGISVFEMDEGIDSGPIVAQAQIANKDMSLDGAIKKTKYMGMDLILTALENIRNNSIQHISNDDSVASYFSFPTREDVREFKKRGNRLI